MSKALLLLCALASPWCGAFTVKYTTACARISTLTQGLNSVPNKNTLDLYKKETAIMRNPSQASNPWVSNFSLTTKAVKRIALSISLFVLMIVSRQQPALANSLIDAIPTSTISSFGSGFLQSFLLIFVSEIGDKTFFIAALLAARYNKFISFAGSIGALAAMTILCTILGQIFHAVPASLTKGIPFDDYIAVAAFTYFGFQTLKDAYYSQDDSSSIEEEKAEAEKSVEELSSKQKRENTLSLIAQTFSLVFAAEIGDKSFLSTIALSAAQNPFSVATGAIAGHAIATGIAVIGGSFLTQYLSEKTIGYIGGSLFLVFAFTTALGIF